jgi:rhodanese-related sulfurtransferase
MKKKFSVTVVVAIMLAFAFIANSNAEEVEPNIPIAANQAFDAVVQQKDPGTGEDARVALIDVRTAAEHFWVGACGKVERIVTEEGDFIPVNGKAELKWGRYLFFQVECGNKIRSVVLPIRKVAEIETAPISIHIPFETWNDADVLMEANEDFNAQIESLAGEYDVLILMCRSGKRSNYTGFDRSLFSAVYEIDQPDGSDGKGGFQGSSYTEVYNGYRGYPGRSTRRQSAGSVSWMDAGLPVHIGWTPWPVTLEKLDKEDGDPVSAP